MPAYVGLDVSQEDVVVAVLLADGRELVPRWSIPNSQSGAAALITRLADLAATQAVDRLRIGLEATELYWWHLALALSEAPALRPYQPQVSVLNPLLIHAFRQHYGALPKTDRADAFLIAERVRFGRQLPPPLALCALAAPHALPGPPDPDAGPGEELLPDLGFGQADPFHDPFGASSRAVLEDFTTESLAQADLAELADYLRVRGRGRFAGPAAIAATLQRAARDSYRLDKVLAESLTLVLGTTMATIRTLQAQLKAVDRTIAQELRALPQRLDSVPGLGPVLTAGLVAEIGAIEHFPDQAALAQYAGLTWPAHESGTFQAEDTRLSKAGNAYLRYYLVEAANSVRVHCPEYTAYYQAKYAQSTKHAHQRALVLTAHKLVRLVDALLRSDTHYRPHTPARMRSPRQARWLLLRPVEELRPDEQVYRRHLLDADAELRCASGLAVAFGLLVRERQREQLDPWLTHAERSGVPEFREFARVMRRDHGAVAAA
ncbi:IS110 family transposase, partial [Nitrolancea hollandica]|uniref:IS110 family transposase n=1 Tax=Nitrolancea hollandica TaxID=1206749 RepID=UPI000686CABE